MDRSQVRTTCDRANLSTKLQEPTIKLKLMDSPPPVFCVRWLYTKSYSKKVQFLHLRSERSDRKICSSSLLRICPIPTTNKWFPIHTREWDGRGHLGLEQVTREAPKTLKTESREESLQPHLVLGFHAHMLTFLWALIPSLKNTIVEISRFFCGQREYKSKNYHLRPWLCCIITA